MRGQVNDAAPCERGADGGIRTARLWWVVFQRWWADPATGKVFCLSEAPNKEAVLRVHAKAGHPTEQISPGGFSRSSFTCR